MMPKIFKDISSHVFEAHGVWNRAFWGNHLEFNYMPNMSKIFENNNVIELTEAINYDILYTIDGKTKDWKDIRG